MTSKYITILDFMIDELNLKGNELIIYALIYGFSQDGKSEFYGSLRYIEKFLKISRPAVIRQLNNLQEKGLIIKTNQSKYKVVTKRDQQLEVATKRDHSGNETLPGVVTKRDQICITNNNNIYKEQIKQNSKQIKNVNNNKTIDLNELNKKDIQSNDKQKKSKNSKTKTSNANKKVLFANSKYNDLKTVVDSFMKMKENDRKKYSGAYLPYYIEEVLDWSDSKDERRTERGWFATIKKFMRNDKKEGTFMTKSIYLKKFEKKQIDRTNSGLLD